GYTDLPGRLPTQASQLYGTNLVNLLRLLTPGKDGELVLDFDDVVQRALTVVRAGEITWPPPPVPVSAAPPDATVPVPSTTAPDARRTAQWWRYAAIAVASALFMLVATVAPPVFLGHFTVFVLACIVGYYVIWNVTPALHTPLMAETNAISGIICVGALLQVGQPGVAGTVLAVIAIMVASINIFGGFAVTNRMLQMFRKG
ncbi:MAG: proton-translocating transhydrogenase family protein, partial [Micromonosporaceae bacterium]